jgi:hypothetical protein
MMDINNIRIAICFSGMIRTGVLASENILAFIGDLLPQCDFFLHTWGHSADKKWHPMCKSTVGPKEDKFSGLYNDTSYYNSYELIHDLTNIYKFTLVSVKSVDTIGYISNGNIPPLYYSWYKSNCLKIEYENISSTKYDVVIKMRPDIIYDLCVTSLQSSINTWLQHPEYFYSADGNAILQDYAYDIFFMGNSKTMDSASRFFEEVNRVGTDTGLVNFLRENSIPIDTSYGIPGSPYRSEAVILGLGPNQYEECLEVDQYCYHPAVEVT